MRKPINGLSAIVMDEFEPFSGNIFAFCNRGRKIIKILFWDQNGFYLWYKRLETDLFYWPCSVAEIINIDARQ